MATTSIREGFRLLKKPAFLKLFFAYVTTHYGNAMAPIAIAFGVLELTGSARDSAFVIAAPITAQIAVLLLGGTLADRTSRQKLMVVGEGVCAAAQFAIAFLFLSGLATVPMLAALMLLMGAAMALTTPSSTGFLVQVVARDELQAANALLGTARNTSFTLGAAIAGVLVALLGAGVTLAIDALTFALSAVFIASIRADRQAPMESASLLKDLRLGWNEFTRHQWLWSIVLQFSLVVAATEAVFGLLGPALMKATMNGAVDWGLVAASSGVGTIIGGLVSMRINASRPMLLATCLTFFFGGTALALALAAPLPVIVLGAFVGGIAGQMFGVLWYTTLQKEIPSHLLSRVSAYDHLGSISLAPLGIIVGGILYESLGAQPTLLIAFTAIVVPGALVLLVPGVRQLRARTD